jgi:hypothetical protein
VLYFDLITLVQSDPHHESTFSSYQTNIQDLENKERMNSLAAWGMVCKPKEKGGLGIINLHLHN